MHESVLAFGKASITRDMVEGKAVLEVGSLNVNGSLRAFVEAMKPASYQGIDIQPGPGVDLVVAPDAPMGGRAFDLIICTEMLEHAPDWRAAIQNMKAALKPGAWLLLTTRSVGFPFHEYPGDHWRFSPANMMEIFADFGQHRIESDPQAPGVFVLVRKLVEPFGPVDLSAIDVHSMHRGTIPAVAVDARDRQTAPRPMFTIIHPTARPDKWPAVWDQWMRYATQPGDVEYILVCDKRWGFNELPGPDFTGTDFSFRAIWNTGRRCY